MELQDQYKTVVNSLKLLATPFDEQKRYMPAFADVPDDVISGFENAFLLFPKLIEENKFSNNAIASILRLHNKIQWCLRNVGLDDFSDIEWNKVRELSKESLSSINEPFEKPDWRYV